MKLAHKEPRKSTRQIHFIYWFLNYSSIYNISLLKLNCLIGNIYLCNNDIIFAVFPLFSSAHFTLSPVCLSRFSPFSLSCCCAWSVSNLSYSVNGWMDRGLLAKLSRFSSSFSLPAHCSRSPIAAPTAQTTSSLLLFCLPSQLHCALFSFSHPELDGAQTNRKWYVERTGTSGDRK